MHRFLVTEVFCNAGVSGRSIVTINNDCVSVVPFEKEVHSTVYIPGSIAILEASKFDEFVADDIELMLNNTGHVVDKNKLDDYLQSSSLYFNGCSQPLVLKLGNPCQIIPTN